MRKLRIAFAVPALALMALGACETVPFAERAAAYEASMSARFIGRSADELVLTLGPPDRTFTLSDRREVFEYEDDRTSVSGGGAYTSWRTVTRQRTVLNPDGTSRVITESAQVPVQEIDPVRTSRQVCVRRFVVDVNDTVESFRWEGNSCF